MQGGGETWRGRRVVVVTPVGRLEAGAAAYVDDAVTGTAPGVLVLDLIRADTTDTDAVAQLLRAMAGARRAGWHVFVTNAAADVEVALRPLAIPAVTTTEGSPAETVPVQRTP